MRWSACIVHRTTFCYRRRVDRNERNAQMLQRQLAGASVRVIAAEFGMSTMGAHAALENASELELARVALRLEQNLRDENGQIEWFAVPDRSGADFDLALAYVRWIVRRLDERKVHTRIHIKPTEGGYLFGLSNVLMDLEDVKTPAEMTGAQTT
jgi:hypothetical protein